MATNDLDVMMGLATEQERIEALRQEDYKAQERKDARNTLRALQELVELPGWKIYQRDSEAYEGAVLTRMATCTDPTTLAKMAGALLELRTRRTWARDRIVELADVLKESP